MKYQATITIAFDATDIYDEHAHRQRLQTLAGELGGDYPQLKLDIRARRPRTRARAAAPAKLDAGVEIIRARYVT